MFDTLKTINVTTSVVNNVSLQEHVVYKAIGEALTENASKLHVHTEPDSGTSEAIALSLKDVQVKHRVLDVHAILHREDVLDGMIAEWLMKQDLSDTVIEVSGAQHLEGQEDTYFMEWLENCNARLVVFVSYLS